ncbi:MAG: aldehyde dehydrogenase family protein [Propylenella sp.]
MTHLVHRADTTRSYSLPTRRGHYYGGAWHDPKSGAWDDVASPATGEALGSVAAGSAEDVRAAIAAAKAAYGPWRDIAPIERAKILRRCAEVLRAHAEELALIDAIDGGNPVAEMTSDAAAAAAQMDYFAGLVTEMKGSTVPFGSGQLTYSVREPLGVVARIIPFNHPLMFCAGKVAAPLAAGNTIIVKPPEQAPLSSLRLAELLDGLFPPGAFNIVLGGAEVGALLASDRDIAKVALIGSVPTGRAVMRAASDTLKKVQLELGGKNALIAYGDADPDEVARNAVAGMNFTWCGQSCGSTSRAFLHASICDAVLERIGEYCSAFKPGLPTERATTMGAIVSKKQLDRVLGYVDKAHKEGARLVYGGKRPDDPQLANGYFFEPTVFAEVTPDMTIAREEIFGPVLSVFRWSDEADMLDQVNSVEYGLTCSIWTNDIAKAHRTARAVDVGVVWINEVSRHYLGAAFGGYKQSGMGREECLEELLGFTQEKTVHVNLKR